MKTVVFKNSSLVPQCQGRCEEFWVELYGKQISIRTNFVQNSIKMVTEPKTIQADTGSHLQFFSETVSLLFRVITTVEQDIFKTQGGLAGRRRYH